MDKVTSGTQQDTLKSLVNSVQSGKHKQQSVHIQQQISQVQNQNQQQQVELLTNNIHESSTYIRKDQVKNEVQKSLFLYKRNESEMKKNHDKILKQILLKRVKLNQNPEQAQDHHLLDTSILNYSTQQSHNLYSQAQGYDDSKLLLNDLDLIKCEQDQVSKNPNAQEQVYPPILFQASNDSDQQSQQSQEEGTKYQSRHFIRFQKTQEQIKKEKQKQQELIKMYTPLNQNQVVPWMTQQIKQIQDPFVRLHNQIRQFYFYIKPSKKQHDKKLAIVQDIRKIIQSLYPQAQLYPFGSFATKLYLPDGDIDIVVLINPETRNTTEQKQYYKTIYQQIRNNQRTKYVLTEYIKNAKTPLVKTYDRQTHFSIDISINQVSGLKQIIQVYRMQLIYPQFRYLVFVLKAMLKIRNLCETYSGGVGSFLLLCMIYHYLREAHKDPKHNGYGLGEYLLGFFSFYYMDIELNKKSIHVKDGFISPRRRVVRSFSMISPLGDNVDIGMKARRMYAVLQLFKNRTKIIKQTNFEKGQSLLKQLINPAMNQFQYYELKLPYINERQKFCQGDLTKSMKKFNKNEEKYAKDKQKQIKSKQQQEKMLKLQGTDIQGGNSNMKYKKQEEKAYSSQKSLQLNDINIKQAQRQEQQVNLTYYQYVYEQIVRRRNQTQKWSVNNQVKSMDKQILKRFAQQYDLQSGQSY